MKRGRRPEVAEFAKLECAAEFFDTSELHLVALVALSIWNFITALLRLALTFVSI